VTSETVNLSRDIVSSARREAELMNRPVKTQLERWARIGRAVESEAGFRKDQVDGALRGEFHADELGRLERAFYNAEHEALMMCASDDEEAFFKALEERLANAEIETHGIGT